MTIKALGNQMTRVVRVNRLKLIETLKKNRATHLDVFNEAMAGYKELALGKVEEAFDGLDTRLRERKAELIKQIGTFTPETAEEFSDHLVILSGVSVNLKLPVSYVDAYDAAIDMAEFDTRDELDLTGAEFQCFVRDVWDWSYEFLAINSNYSNKLAR